MARWLLGLAVALGVVAIVMAARPDGPHVVVLPTGPLDVDPPAPAASAGEPRRPVLRAWRPPAAPAGEPASDPARPRPVPQASAEALGRTRGWLASVRAFHGLPPLPPQEARDRLVRLLLAAVEPVIRQNLVFHLALGVPDGLDGLEAACTVDGACVLDDEDREDVRVARAFAGQPDAVEAFLAEAVLPSGAAVRRLMDGHDDMEALGEGGGSAARAILRSYHAIEVLDRDPYFDMLTVRVPLVWSDVAPPAAEPLRTALHEAWLTRWPGHPGSDDVALRLARAHIARGTYEDAARWYGRAATLPDQDVTRQALGGMVAFAELYLDRETIPRLAAEEGLSTPNHQLLLYIAARRTAAEVGPEAGLDIVREALRHADVPVLDVAWRMRWSASPPEGLRSGLVPLPEDDPLRRTETVSPELRKASAVIGWGDDRPREEQRLDPRREAQHIHPGRLARQLRIWETLVELEDRASRARPWERADLAYKAAAVLYHELDAFHPAYAWHSWEFGQGLREAWGRAPDAFRAGAERFRATSFNWRRALDAFQALVDAHPESDLLDRARFSMGLCWRRLLDYRPRHVFTDTGEDEGLQDEAVDNLVAHMGSVTRLHPQSPLADDAARAVAYWTTWRQRRDARQR